MGLPFMPVRGIIGTDYLKIREDFKVIKNPYGDDEIVVVPAITPDVALIHAYKADKKGNILVDNFENDPLLARASRNVFVSCEEIVEYKEELLTTKGVIIPDIYITGVIHLPGGAKPTRCNGYYGWDEGEIIKYINSAKDEELFREYLEDFLLE